MMPLALAGRDLLVLDRAGGVGDVGLAVAELLEAAAGAGLTDGDLHVGLLLLEQLGGGLGQGKDGAGSVDVDRAAESFAVRRALDVDSPASPPPQAARPRQRASATAAGAAPRTSGGPTEEGFIGGPIGRR